MHQLGRRRVFAGQRADAFHVDLGSIFDLGALRPFNEAHLISMPNMNGKNAVQSYNVHTLAIQVPIEEVTAGDGIPTDPMSPRSVIGVWATASRRKGRVFNAKQGKYVGNGPWVQVSRLGNPLFNEVIVPMAEKDAWNSAPPANDAKYTKYVNKPELAGLLPVLYPGVFPNLAAYTKPRADLNAILMTGIPEGVVPGFQNYTGSVQSDMLRLNVAIPPSESENSLGLVAWRRGRLPQRAPDRGRRRDDRAAGGRGTDDPAGRPVVHPRRCRQRRGGRDDGHQRPAARHLPVPRSARWRLPDRARHHAGVMTAGTAVGHRPPDSPENPHAGQGCVLLDIGGDVGAVVVTTPASMVGVEVEIAPEGTAFGHDHHHGHGHLDHVAVVRRPVQGGEVPALVFGALTSGRYALAEKGTADVRLLVDVRGGEVTSAEWPAS